MALHAYQHRDDSGVNYSLTELEVEKLCGELMTPGSWAGNVGDFALLFLAQIYQREVNILKEADNNPNTYLVGQAVINYLDTYVEEPFRDLCTKHHKAVNLLDNSAIP